MRCGLIGACLKTDINYKTEMNMKIIYTCLASLLLSGLASLAGDTKGKVEEEIRQEILKNTTVSISSAIQDIGLAK